VSGVLQPPPRPANANRKSLIGQTVARAVHGLDRSRPTAAENICQLARGCSDLRRGGIRSHTPMSIMPSFVDNRSARVQMRANSNEMSGRLSESGKRFSDSDINHPRGCSKACCSLVPLLSCSPPVLRLSQSARKSLLVQFTTKKVKDFRVRHGRVTLSDLSGVKRLTK
jgi:hypothetical protein